MKEGSEVMTRSEKIKGFDDQRWELVTRINQLETELPLQGGAVEMLQLEVRIAEINQDQEGWMLEEVEEKLAALGDSSEHETERAKLVKQKKFLEESRERRAERFGARI